jgi:hypothetical protein
MMMWDEGDDSQTQQQQQQQQQPDQDSCFNFDLLSLLSRPKVVAFPFDFYFFCHIRVRNWQCMQDYYKILEVDYDATDDAIRSNYIRLALVLILDFSLFFFFLGYRFVIWMEFFFGL